MKHVVPGKPTTPEFARGDKPLPGNGRRGSARSTARGGPSKTSWRRCTSGTVGVVPLSRPVFKGLSRGRKYNPRNRQGEGQHVKNLCNWGPEVEMRMCEASGRRARNKKGMIALLTSFSDARPPGFSVRTRDRMALHSQLALVHAGAALVSSAHQGCFFIRPDTGIRRPGLLR